MLSSATQVKSARGYVPRSYNGSGWMLRDQVHASYKPSSLSPRNRMDMKHMFSERIVHWGAVPKRSVGRRL